VTNHADLSGLTHLDNFIVTRNLSLSIGTVQKHMPTLTLRCAQGRLQRQLPIPPGRYSAFAAPDRPQIDLDKRTITPVHFTT